MDVIAGDWFVGKAASSVVVVHPVLGEVEVFNTHVSLVILQSVYLAESPADMAQLFAKGGADGTAHRLINAWEFAKLARMSAEKGRYVIAVRLVCLTVTLRLLIHSLYNRLVISTAFPPRYP